MADISVSYDQKDNKPNKKRKLPGSINKKYLIIGLIVITLLAVGLLGYQKYNSLKEENQRLSNPQEAQKLETEVLLERVSQHIEVPSDEQPTVATVVDASKLKNQTFFANAENGDKVLLFAQAKKAVLYRPSTDKVIEVAPINIGENQDNKSENQNQESAEQDNTQQ